MQDTPTPAWQPIERLPLIAEMIDGYLADAQKQEQTLREARQRPHVFDDALVDRIDRVYGEALEMANLFAQQLRRWRNSGLTVDQEQDVARLEGQVLCLRQRLTAILALAAEIRQGTIDRVMEKSDLELGLEVLLDIRPPPG
jgi:cell division septum initiation protein DivIVA